MVIGDQVLLRIRHKLANDRTIDYSGTVIHSGEAKISHFNYTNTELPERQLTCYNSYVNIAIYWSPNSIKF